ncbi:tricarboxylic transporter [Natrarchaeobius halalkaliphilus]|uniref:Tricarboxylic transporter n=1 Tax=Natrarchaeobius halalkaliphilus TaxID=1679091 RepID=A0A3N6LNY5_9EURY|nr:tripartite tricarboxylate transporter permease [Natrarchaeobius halalkaliphilus]RQG87917.1 tricarboxylic transporter [Natrarchaeobius halalkaliphilus]
MSEILSAAVQAAEVLFTWPTIGFLILGTLIGLIFGAIPGLGGAVAIALLIPLTWGVDTSAAMVLFAATLGGATFGGSISAILINTPGTPPNAATLLDGFPLTRQGRSGEALATSATASALGAVFGVIVLLASLPVAREIVLAFGSPEFFWLGVVGVSVIATISRGSTLKGMIAGGFGFMLSFIGYQGATAEYRFSLGTTFLWDGLELIVVLIGIFAVGEAINLATEEGKISQVKTKANRSDIVQGIKNPFKHWFLFLRSSVIGSLVGMIPGAGGALATFISYAQAVQTSDNAEKFGDGDVRGVIAAEAANDSSDGGALIPTVVFGIPGSVATAVLLGAFIFHGLSPGQQLLNDNLDILLLIIFALVISNVLTSLIGVVSANQVAKITQIDTNLLIAPILVISFVGAFGLRTHIGDVGVVAIFGLIGYLMLRFGYSRIAFVIGIILGPIIESSFLQSLSVSGGSYMIFFERPLSIFLIVILVLNLTAPFIRRTLR